MKYISFAPLIRSYNRYQNKATWAVWRCNLEVMGCAVFFLKMEFASEKKQKTKDEMRLLRWIAIAQCRRHASTSSALARALQYEAYGDPQQVLSLVEVREKETTLKQTLGDDEV